MNKEQPQYTQVFVEAAQSNGLGVAGFIVSLIGLFFCCGWISPLGLLFSFIALAWAPRGFAFAGVVLGMIGSAWLILIGATFSLGFIGMGAAATADVSNSVTAPATIDAQTAPSAFDETAPVQIDDQPAPYAGYETAPTFVPPVEPVDAGENPPSPVDEPDAAPADRPSVAEIQAAARERERQQAEARRTRTWTSANGQFTITAKFIKAFGGNVTLEKDGGEQITLPLDKLSDADRDWLNRRGWERDDLE